MTELRTPDQIYTWHQLQEDKVLLGKLVEAERYKEAAEFLQQAFMLTEHNSSTESQIAGMLFILDLLMK